MQDKKVVVIGGGPGTDVTLSGLKRHTSQLTALVSTFDRSSTRYHHGKNGGLNGSPSVDEVRSSLLALGPDPATTALMERLFAHRFAASADLEGLTFGNLFLTALTEITGAADLALQAAARVLNVHGQVLPITLEECLLYADLADGREVAVTSPSELIAASEGTGVLRVRLGEPAPALGAALQAIRNADIILLGPADLHFGILAPLQLEGVSEALAESHAVRIFICNLMTQANTTQGWPASRFIRSVLAYVGGPGCLDGVIVNSAPISAVALAAAAEGSAPVQVDLDACLSLGLNVIVRPVASGQSLLHDPEKLARTVLFLGGGRSTRRSERSRFFTTAPLAELPAADVLTPRGAES
jgi:uncharacterized cofD-like protein